MTAIFLLSETKIAQFLTEKFKTFVTRLADINKDQAQGISASWVARTTDLDMRIQDIMIHVHLGRIHTIETRACCLKIIVNFGKIVDLGAMVTDGQGKDLAKVLFSIDSKTMEMVAGTGMDRRTVGRQMAPLGKYALSMSHQKLGDKSERLDWFEGILGTRI